MKEIGRVNSRCPEVGREFAGYPMPPKKRQRRAWEDKADGSDDDDDEIDPFGLAAAAEEERRIKARRRRLEAAGPAEASRPRAKDQVGTGIGGETFRDADGRVDTTVGSVDPGRDLRARLLRLRGEEGKNFEKSSATKGDGDEGFDMFADTPVGSGVPDRKRNGHGGTVGAGVDGAADEDGYARLRLDELLDGGRYITGPACGQGVFASVYRATEVKTGSPVAVKVLRDNDVMRKAGKVEVDVLQRIVDADQADKRHCVRMLASFEHRGHSVIVFERLAMNLRDVVKRFGGGGGIRLAAVRLYASQLLRALSLLSELGVVHADIKPDNALVSEDKAVVKLCDFGSAMDEKAGESDATPYLVSRFYRAPEVVLGVLPYTRAIDIWSLGCVLFELYTGRIAFAGKSNNDMLRLVQELRGAVPSRLVRRSTFRARHFDDSGRFIAHYIDSATGAPAVRVVAMPERGPRADGMRAAILAAAADDDDKDAAPLLADLIYAMLTVDPARRITATSALKMPIFAARKGNA